MGRQLLRFPRPGRTRGFTLIEVAVVMLLIVIVLGVVSVNLEPDRESPVRDEAWRLAALVRTAQQESVLQGRILALVLEDRKYHFRVLNDGNEFVPLEDETLRARPLPPGIVIASVNIEGGAEDARPRLILLPTGELPPFTIVFARGNVRWQVTGTLTGEISTRAAPAGGKA